MKALTIIMNLSSCTLTLINFDYFKILRFKPPFLGDLGIKICDVFWVFLYIEMVKKRSVSLFHFENTILSAISTLLQTMLLASFH